MIYRSTLLLVFFASGFAALIYQIIWQRLLSLITGTDSQSVTIIVAAVMAGLGAGSLCGGYAADRLGTRARLRLFAICELAIASFAFISVPLFYDGLYARFGSHQLSAVSAAALHAAATAWPTFFMGVAFPLMLRALTSNPAVPSRWIAIAFGVNTFGAAAGAFATVTVLMPSMDFKTIMLVGALVNTGCALVAAIAARTQEDAPAADPVPKGHDHRAISPLATWLGLFALSGFTALALEVIWFRILGVMLKTDAATFGIFLTLYLGGLAAGAIASESRAVLRWPAARSYLFLQAAIPIYSALAITAAVLIPTFAPTRWLAPLAMMSVPTFLMGLSFGCLQRAVHDDIVTLGRRIGWLQCANVAGAVAGALATGLLLIDRIGTVGTIRGLVLGGGAFLWLALRDAAVFGSARRAVAALAVPLAVMIALPDRADVWSRLHGSNLAQAIVAADGSGVAVLKEESHMTRLFVNGRAQSELPYRGLQTDLGIVPTMVHPNPVRIAVIGLGSGNTSFSAGGRPETKQIDTVEIVAPVFTALREYDARRAYPALNQLLCDMRMHYFFTDGRAFLSKTRERYDIIEADALRPDSAYAGNIYSVEYFSLLRKRLAPGGYAVTWLPTTRVPRSLRAVFPYVEVWGELGIGSEQPLNIDADTIRERVRRPYTQNYFRNAGIDVDTIMAEYLLNASEPYTPHSRKSAASDLNRDLFPRDEFHVPD
jgi:predicted membrane-bound spermidine synthase